MGSPASVRYGPRPAPSDAQRLRAERGVRTGTRRVLLALFASTLLPATLPGTPSLETVLANMDAAASAWKGMRANVTWERYRSLVDDRAAESGRIAVRRLKSGGVEMLIEFVEPSHYFFSVRQAKVEIYKPRIKTVEHYDASKSREKLENALLLGFGTAGSYLRQHYEIELLGADPVAGHAAVRLDLQPKDPRGELNNTRIEMWISTTHWQPVSQKVYDRHTRDYRTYSYADMEVSPSFRSDEFKMSLAPGTKHTRPQLQ